MELKGRLELISKKIPKSKTVADIGTDHAYIPICLIETNQCEKAIASDIKKGPLKIAQKNIIAAGLENKIEIRYGNGLDTIGENEAEVIVIAGMGGLLVADILEAGKTKAIKTKSLILQPMNHQEDVRKWLYENSFEIYDEELCNESNKIYSVICARSQENKKIEKTMIEPVFLHIGQKLIEKKDPLLEKLIQNKVRLLEKSIKEMKNASGKYDAQKERYTKLCDDLKELLKKIKIKE